MPSLRLLMGSHLRVGGGAPLPSVDEPRAEITEALTS